MGKLFYSIRWGLIVLLFGCAELSLEPKGSDTSPIDVDSQHGGSDSALLPTDDSAPFPSDLTDTDPFPSTDGDSDSTPSTPNAQCTLDNAVLKCGAANLCVDGYCCDTPCDRACEACDVAGSEGVCTAFKAGEDPEDECGPCLVCNGKAFAPSCEVVPRGEDLKRDCGPCRYCNGEKEDADCIPAAFGEDPFDDCEASEPASCGVSGVCDGLGGCALYSTDTVCKAAVCTDLESESGQVSYRCDGNGKCKDRFQVCGGYLCEVDVDRCLRECGSKADCAAGYSCANASCVVDAPKEDGRRCLYDGECESGVCSDEVCCDKACDGDCVACDLPGKEGHCTDVPPNTDPKDRCPRCFACDEDGACAKVPAGEDFADDCAEDISEDGCGATGLCDGNGGCALFDTDKSCGETICIDVERESAQTAHVCDGRGNCDEVATSCGGFLCADETTCFDSCESASDCTGTAVCESKRCVMNKPNGEPCRSRFECEAGYCVDGVCCESTCDGACERCDNPKQKGTCAKAPDYTDPDDDCPICEVCLNGECAPAEEGADPAGDCTEGMPGECAYTGACDGASACAIRGNDYGCATDCRGEKAVELTCSGDAVGDSSCNQVGEIRDCEDHLLCDPQQSACPTECLSFADCVEAYYCEVGGTCQPEKETGDVCTGDSSCRSGMCVDGVCCDSPCDGVCEGCAVKGSEGTCMPFPNGGDPDDDCEECSACDGKGACIALDDAPAPDGDCTDIPDVGDVSDALCGHTGECAEGLCVYEKKGTTCGDLKCEGAKDKPNVTLYQCDGEGACVEILDKTCGGFRCASPSKCLTECEDVSDCAVSFSCNEMVCTSDNPNGTPCMLGTECDSGFCIDGVCCESACDGLCEGCDVLGHLGACVPEPNGEWGTSPSTSETDCPACEVCDGKSACRPVDTALFPDDSRDPGNLCGDPTDPSTCGRTGMCEDGLGVCALYPTSEWCANGCPTPGNELFSYHCDGEGKCVQDEISSPCPNDLNCSTGEEDCLDTCSKPGDCIAADFCNADGACEPKKEDGDSCGAPRECISGNCPSEDGVCCDDACVGLCESCALEESVGQCQKVPEGEDPQEECDDGLYCTLDDYCDGLGMCAHDGNPCDETDENDCNDCNETSDRCLMPFGSDCGDSLGDDCTHPDTCNWTGACVSNHEPDGTECSPDADSCTFDVCNSGVCTHPDSGDSDGDTVCDAVDNCPTVSNLNQANGDGDKAGDACDACPSDASHTEGPCLSARLKMYTDTTSIHVSLEIYNYETNPVSTNGLTLRYWYTTDAAFTSQSLECYWVDNMRSFPGGCQDLVRSPESAIFYPVNRTNANYYMQLAFAGNRTIAAYSGATPGRTGEMQIAWHTNNFITCNPSNDYSYSNFGTLTQTDKVTLYVGNTLVWGKEP